MRKTRSVAVTSGEAQIRATADLLSICTEDSLLSGRSLRARSTASKARSEQTPLFLSWSGAALRSQVERIILPLGRRQTAHTLVVEAKE